jgi:hypothetical protein
LFTRTQEHDDRAPSTSARQAAEALFTPKPQRIEPSSREVAPTGEAARKPRVLAIATARPVPQDEPEVPISAKPSVTPVIPAAQFARIRAWMKYGMTAAQVAEVYGVAASEIEHILRTA